jgi:DNA-binding NtrC family response regulator
MMTTTFHTLLAHSRAMRDVKEHAQHVAAGTQSVFVDGEPGTGRKLLARFVHETSANGHKPIVDVRCDILTVDVLDRVLCGDRESGSAGLLEQAAGGTLLLVRLEDLNPVAQERLRAIFEMGQFKNAQGQVCSVTCRMMATGDSRELKKQVRLGRFSPELLGMLTQSKLVMPPLAQRKEDVPHLVTEILGELAARERIEAPQVPYHYMELLMDVPWPENVRQLRNHVESVMTLASGRFDPEIIRAHFVTEGSAGTIKGALQTLWQRLRGTVGNPALNKN